MTSDLTLSTMLDWRYRWSNQYNGSLGAPLPGRAIRSSRTTRRHRRWRSAFRCTYCGLNDFGE